MNIQQIRDTEGGLDDYTDAQVAYMVWSEPDFKDEPMGLFADELGLDSKTFKEFVSYAKEDGKEVTGRTFAEGVIPEGSEARAGLQGQLMGLGTRATAAAETARDFFTDKPSSFSMNLERQQDQLKQYRKEDPWGALGYEVAGSFATPIPAATIKTAGVIAPKAINAVENIANATGKYSKLKKAGAAGVAGGITGGLYEAGESREGEELEGFTSGMKSGALFGMGAQQLANTIQRLPNKLKVSFDNSIRRPTVESLKATKQRAYEEVDKAGDLYDKNDLTPVITQVWQKGKELQIDKDMHPISTKAFNFLKKKIDEEDSYSLTHLDNIRKNLQFKKKVAMREGEPPVIDEMIDSLDNVIQSVSSNNELVQAARIANARFKKVEMIDDALKAADINTKVGINADNLTEYKKVIGSILKNDKKNHWFDDDEIKMMNQFVDAPFTEDMLRKIGSFSPTSGGLLSLVHLMSVSANPALLTASLATAGAKAATDTIADKKARDLISKLSGQTIDNPMQSRVPAASYGGNIGNVITNTLTGNQ